MAVTKASSKNTVFIIFFLTKFAYPVGDFMILSGPIPVPPGAWDWPSLMEQALAEARQAKIQGEVPVGAVVVDSLGRILSRAHNTSLSKNDPAGHAEIGALRKAAKRLGNYRLNGCYLIVTLEPCAMCASAIVHARLDGLVYAAYDSKAGAVVSQMEFLDEPWLNHKVWHMGGILESEAASLLENFFVSRRGAHHA